MVDNVLHKFIQDSVYQIAQSAELYEMSQGSVQTLFRH